MALASSSRHSVPASIPRSYQPFELPLQELYQGEIIGEIILDKMLHLFSEPDLKQKIGVALQLETETKARLRPALMQLGLDIAEAEGSREVGLELATVMRGKNWREAMSTLRDIVKPAVERYQEIAAAAPAEFQSLAQSMVVHEQSLLDFAEQELSDNTENSLDAIIAQLEHKPV